MAVSLIIADDHPVMLQGLVDQLRSVRRHRFDICDTVSNGRALLRSLRGRECALALVDWHMPARDGPDGHTLIAQLRQTFPQLGIVVMTASRQPTLLGTCLNLGVRGLYDKHGGIEELQQILIQVGQGKLSVSPHFETVLNRHYLSRRHWGVDNHHLLSAKEREVITLSAQGYSGRDIAARLARSEKTISRQRRSALDKLGLNADAEPPYLVTPHRYEAATHLLQCEG